MPKSRPRCTSGSRPWPKTDPLINLLHGGATCASCGGSSETTTGHSSLRHPTATTRGLVHLHHDGVDYPLQLLLLAFKFILLGKLVLVEPIQGLLDSILNLLLVSILKLFLELPLLERVAHREAIVLQPVLGFDLCPVGLVLCSELLRLLHHTVNLRLRQAPLLVGDGDLVGLARRLVLRRDIEDSICINIEGHLDLGDPTRCRWNPIQVELAEQIVVFRHGSLTLKDLNEHTGLVVRISGEGLPLLRRNCGVALN